MDQQLKTRLIGVTIVVSLVVIFVPMLFEDSSDREAATIGGANVPEFPQEFQSQTLPLPSTTPKMAAVPPVAEPAPVREEPLDPLDVPTAGGEPADDMGGREPSGDALLPEKAPVKPRLARPAATPPAAPVAPAKAAPVAKEAPAKPADKSKPTPVAEPLAKTPAAAAPAAPAVAAKPKATPAATAKPAAAEAKPAAAAPAAPVKMTAWIIQAGSFGDEANAKTLLVKLRQANISAFVEMIPSASGNSYRVRVGPELDRARAEATLKKMEAEAGVKGMIVSYP